MTVGELLARVDSRELTEWMAYDQIEPFGAWRADLHAGIVAATMANAHRPKERKPFEPQDFMPKFAQEAPQNDLAGQMAIFGMLAVRGAPATPEATSEMIDRWWQSATTPPQSGE